MKLFSEHNQEFRHVLELATKDELVIFVGAGCSIEAGLPDWNRLVSRYINLALLMQSGIEVLDERRDSVQDVIPHQLLEEFGSPPRLAIIADAIVGPRRQEILNLALYPDLIHPKCGPTAKEIAKLYRERLKAGLKTYLVTTNYDPLLEVALDQYVQGCVPGVHIGAAEGFGMDRIFLSKRTRSKPQELSDRELRGEVIKQFGWASRGGTDDQTHIPKVFHLHGGIDFRDHTGLDPVVLTERDFADHQWFAQLVLSLLLKKRPCLLVGLSLEDNDVISALYAEMGAFDKLSPDELPTPQVPRYVLAFNEMRGLKAAVENDPRVKHVRSLESQRQQLLGVTPIKNLKNFAQIPQVLHEMGVATRESHRRKDKSSSAYWTSSSAYGKRLDRWKADFNRKYNPMEETVREANKFIKGQQLVSDAAECALEEILRDLVGATVVSDELAIHAWVRSSDSDAFEMFLWCGNEYARRRGMSFGLSRVITHSEFNLALRQAFEGVSSRGFRPAADQSRWAQVMAVPIISPTHQRPRHSYGRLLMGVVTLSTTLPPDESDLTDYIADRKSLLGEIEDRLEKLGRKLFVEDLKG